MSLQSDIQNVFDAMADGSKDDSYFCEKIAAAIKTFANSCSLVCMPSTLAGADSGPSGTFTGAGTAQWQTKGSPIESALKDICAKMKKQESDDSDLAQAFADGLDDDAPTFTITISGSTVVPGTPPVTVPSSDSGTVTATFNSAAVKSGLSACFNSMKSMSSGGDTLFATTLATLIMTYYTTAVISFTGATHLAAVAGTILVTPGS